MVPGRPFVEGTGQAGRAAELLERRFAAAFAQGAKSRIIPSGSRLARTQNWNAHVWARTTHKVPCNGAPRKLSCGRGVVRAESAHKHGVTDEDMLHAFRNAIQVTYHDEGFTLRIGPDPAGNLLEVGTVDAEDAVVIVHAMCARPKKIR